MDIQKKAPGKATKPFYIDWKDYVEHSVPPVPDDVILESVWSVAPAGNREDAIERIGAGYDGLMTHIWLTGGKLGERMEISNTVTFQSGITDTKIFLLLIENK